MSLENLLTRISELNTDDLQKVSKHANTLEKLRMAKNRLHDFVNQDFSEIFPDIDINEKIIQLLANAEVKEINEQQSLEYGTGSSKLYFPSVSKTVIIKWETSMWTKHGVQWNHKRFHVYKDKVNNEQKDENLEELYMINMVHSDFENETECSDGEEILEFLQIDTGDTEYIQQEFIEPLITGLFSVFEKYQHYELRTSWENSEYY